MFFFSNLNHFDNFHRTIRLVNITLLAIWLVGCKQDESNVSPKIASLIGTWQLVDPDSTHNTVLTLMLDTAHPPQDITPFLASGKSAVNKYSVRLFATLDGTMSSESWSNTERSGSALLTSFEQAYFENLRAVVRFDMPSQTRLYLYHGGSVPHVLTYDRLK